MNENIRYQCIAISAMSCAAAVIMLMGCSRMSSGEALPSNISVAQIFDDSKSTPQIDSDELTATSVFPGIVRWEAVAPLTHDVAIMESVFWEPGDTVSLRSLIFESPQIKGARVLEIGTGSGLISLCCLQAGAAHVVATDLNPNAIQNVRFNASGYGLENLLDARLVPRRDPGAWSVIAPAEQFDFIISNPPWENDKPQTVAEFALYDPDFVLLDSLVLGARQRLQPNGRMWLAYGCVTAIRRIESLAKQENLNYTQRDERSLDELPEVFLPGMLLELTVPTTESEHDAAASINFETQD